MRTIQIQLSEKQYKKIKKEIKSLCQDEDYKMKKGWEDEILSIISDELKTELLNRSVLENLWEDGTFRQITIDRSTNQTPVSQY